MTGPVVMRLVHKTGIAMPWSDDVPVGDFLSGWDLEYAGGVGAAWWTPNLDEAFRFPHAAAAMEAYRARSKTRPIRPDGQPNRPLTAYTVEVVTVESVEASR